MSSIRSSSSPSAYIFIPTNTLLHKSIVSVSAVAGVQKDANSSKFCDISATSDVLRTTNNSTIDDDLRYSFEKYYA